MDHVTLLQMAEAAREKAYAPYSHFQVGAALLCASGKVYTGCNIENMSYSATVCAERTALYKAVSEGERAFVAIAISGGPEGEQGGFCAPCGICRQVMAEHCTPGFEVVFQQNKQVRICRLDELLAHAFTDLHQKGE